jgi:hypothetical protein
MTNEIKRAFLYVIARRLTATQLRVLIRALELNMKTAGITETGPSQEEETDAQALVKEVRGQVKP